MVRSTGRSDPLPQLEASYFVRAHIGRSPCRFLPPRAQYFADLPGQEWQNEIFTVRVHICRSTGPPPVEVPSGQEWQYEIATVRAHNVRSSGRSPLPQ